MRRTFLPLFALLALSQQAAGGAVVAHCPGLDYRDSNDPKAIYGERAFGQTFAPRQDRISFIRLKAGKAKTADTKGVTPALELRLWKCAADYKRTKANMPVASAVGVAPFVFGSSLFFRMEAALQAKAQYFWEVEAPAEPQAYWNIWYMYGAGRYLDGNFAVEGNRRGGCDADFSTYYPVPLVQGAKLSAIPEIVEIQFDSDMDVERTKAGFEAQGIQVKGCQTIWSGKSRLVLFIPPSAVKGKDIPCRLKVDAIGLSGAAEKLDIQFSASQPEMEIPAAAAVAEPAVVETCKLQPDSHGRVFRGKVKADLSIKPLAGGACEFGVNAHFEPLTGLQIDLSRINAAEVDKMVAHNINSVSMILPDFVGKPEELGRVKVALSLLHEKGILVFWLVCLEPLGYDKSKVEVCGNPHKVSWNGKELKGHCFVNPAVREAFNLNMARGLKALKESGEYFDAVMVNEPGRSRGEFCYCPHCKKAFLERYGHEMPLPVNLSQKENAIPVVWSAGLPKDKHMKPEDKAVWAEMSSFYCAPVTERMADMFKIFRKEFPQTSCQITTYGDIAPYYGIDFWGESMKLEDLDGIYCAFYWAVGGRPPEKDIDTKIAERFVAKAKERGISCSFWLQGYDAGDNSQPLQPGSIKDAVKLSFAKGADGIFIWSYLNPILGPWDKPYHWPEYYEELKDGLAPFMKKAETSSEKILLKEGENKKLSFGDGFQVELSYDKSGTATALVKRDGYATFKKEMNVKTGRDLK